MEKKMEMEDGKKSLLEKKHFVLVHGACHGAWCWYKLATLLRSAGHRVTALDLAASGVDPKQVNDLRSFSDYIQPLMKFFKDYNRSSPTVGGGGGATEQPAEEKVILVGHSMGGLAISKVIESFPDKIYVAVFVTALVRGPALDMSAVFQEGSRGDSRYTYDEGPENPATTFIFGPNYISSYLYDLCPPEDVSLANMLARPIRLYSDEEEMSKKIVVSEEKDRSVRRVYIICDEDKALPKDFQLSMIENNPVDEVKEITGSDHMVMLSKTHELSACLQEIAEA